MNKKSVAVKIIQNSDGIVSTANFISAGMTSYDVSMLCKEGSNERIRHGLYKLPHSISGKIDYDKILGAILPQGGICVESALFHYVYSDKTPDKLYVEAFEKSVMLADNRSGAKSEIVRTKSDIDSYSSICKNDE